MLKTFPIPQISMDDGTTPYWRIEDKQLAERIHVMWKSDWSCERNSNQIKVQIKNAKLGQDAEHKWSWSRGEYNIYKKFQRGTMGRLCHKREPLSVLVSIEDRCHPIARLQIFSDPLNQPSVQGWIF